MSLWSKLRRHVFSKRTGHLPAIQSASDTKIFPDELRLFNQKLSSGNVFSLVRFGDGEMLIVQGKATDLSGKYNGEHKYTPGADADEAQRKRLARSLHYQNNRYFVGIACPCCVGTGNFTMLKDTSKQREEQLTWANLFVNSNYALFLDETVPLLKNLTVNMICHEKADVSRLSFSVNQSFVTRGNAWLLDYERVGAELDTYIETSNATGEVFLFCAGVLSNILVMELTEKHPHNTYIDLGSVFDAQMGLGATRKYLKKGKNLRKTCVWG